MFLISCFPLKRFAWPAGLAARTFAVLVVVLAATERSHGQFEWFSGKQEEAAKLKREADALLQKQHYIEALPLLLKSTSL